ncbi:MAG: MFS transporter [Gammaproteobacteria bacterium]|nr:MFS transporter [Gammaproteobacteria bacterium]
MNPNERKSVISIALIMTFRMLGLFMIFPVFTPYAQHIAGATPQLIGLALGIYGLTQACLQIPFGALSDRFGRKPIICLGLLIFAIGSVVAACAHSIEGIIMGRALQGGGAIGSAAMALIADLTQNSQRTKAMAIIGMSIGLAFALAMVAGPMLNGIIGVPGIFWLTALLALIAIAILYLCVGNISNSDGNAQQQDPAPQSRRFKQILTNKQLVCLDIGVFIQHAMLTALFMILPLVLQQNLHLSSDRQWLFYLPILVCAYILMVPFIILAEKKQHMKAVFIGSITVLLLSQLLLWQWHQTWLNCLISLILFFTAFTLLEATLPSLVSKIAPAANKGAAMGVYSTSQFLGIFLGGVVGGWLFANGGISAIFLGCALAYLLWLLIAIRYQTFSL